MPQRECGGQRTTCWSQLSPPTAWVPGTEPIAFIYLLGCLTSSQKFVLRTLWTNWAYTTQGQNPAQQLHLQDRIVRRCPQGTEWSHGTQFWFSNKGSIPSHLDPWLFYPCRPGHLWTIWQRTSLESLTCRIQFNIRLVRWLSEWGTCHTAWWPESSAQHDMKEEGKNWLQSCPLPYTHATGHTLPQT